MEKNKIKSENKSQHCVFILWSNGFKHAPEIIDIIRDYPEIEIQKVFLYQTDNIKKFIDQVYVRDDVPRVHLKKKTKYIKQSKNPNIAVVLAKNHNPQEILRGRGEFRHIECQRVKDLKDKIRNQYNPKKTSGDRTEEHVIHATDSEHHVDHLLKVLGYKEGLQHFAKTPNRILSVPHHIKSFSHFTIKKVPINSIYCHFITGTRHSFSTEIMPLKNSPHYKFLIGEPEAYKKYLKEFSGIHITDDYSPTKFKELSENFSYLSSPNQLNYILADEFQLNKYVIRNGLHRAVILKHQGYKEIPILIKQ